MKRITSFYLIAAARLITILAAGLVLTACGNGGGGGGGGDGGDQSAGVGGTGIVYGKTTGFGSIYVNGDRYKTNDSKFIVDGDPNASQDDLAIGMVVKLKVKTLDGKLTDKAIEVVYDDEVQGPVDATPVIVSGTAGSRKTFQVFGQTVTIDEVATIFENTDFDTLDANDVVEVSGFRTAPDAITATYVEFKETLDINSEVEIRGNIENLVAGPPQAFEISGIAITTDGNTEIDVPGGVLQNDQFVEVEGRVSNLAPLTILAEEIEVEDELFGDDEDDVSLQGIISNFVDSGDFEINGLKIDASGAEFKPANAENLLGDGVEVEVEGSIVGGVLIADQLELRDGEAELRSTVGTVDVGDSSFTVSYPVGSVTVRVDSQTVFEDDLGGPVTPPFSLDDLMNMDFVRVEGREVNDEIVANTIKRRDSADDTLRLEGHVDAYNAGVSITVLGIQYGLNPGTNYNPDPPNIVIGDRVEIEDDNDPLPADGFADNVEEDN